VATNRDFSSISPSAKMLLLVKSQTTLPFAREAAELLWGAQAVESARANVAVTPGAVKRREHFEARARSVDEALRDLGAKRVLEIAGGLSFRGLAMAARDEVFYLDTDLPAIAAIKSGLVPRLHPAPLAGKLVVHPLDALDGEAFRAAVSEIPRGPIAVVHEGLLMYLDDAEKARLATNVREALLERGGAWITADVYRRSETHLFRDERTKKFLEEHRVEEKKFADFSAAEAFFNQNGFAVTRRLFASDEPSPTRETWVLLPCG
jgi:O-methyltransferase involved in polyketide biosynthesis